MKLTHFMDSVQSMSMHILANGEREFKNWLTIQHITKKSGGPLGITAKQYSAILKWIDDELQDDEETEDCKAGFEKLRGKHVFADAACISWDWE